MRLTIATLLALASLASAAAPPLETYAGLRKEFSERLWPPRGLDEDKATRAAYARRLLAFAKRHPKSDDAFVALAMCVLQRRSHVLPNTPAAEALKLLRDYAEHPGWLKYAPSFGVMPGDDTSKLLRAVADRHPDRVTRAKAVLALSKGRLLLAHQGEALQPFSVSYYLRNGENLRIHHEYEHHVHGTHGEGFTKLLIASVKKHRAEHVEMSKRLAKDYPGLFPDLSVGKAAPEIVSQGLDGKPVRLSDLKGKVVVLDIWATWCGPCREMIPHQRELVKRLEGKPFALVSVSVDDSPEVLTKFLKKTPMPWAHWWNGPGRGLVVDWDVSGYPTIYVLDHKGVIRHLDLRDKKLDAAVDRLVRDAEAAK